MEWRRLMRCVARIRRASSCIGGWGALPELLVATPEIKRLIQQRARITDLTQIKAVASK